MSKYLIPEYEFKAIGYSSYLESTFSSMCLETFDENLQLSYLNKGNPYVVSFPEFWKPRYN